MHTSIRFTMLAAILVALGCADRGITPPPPGGGNGGGSPPPTGVTVVEFTPSVRHVTAFDSITLVPVVKTGTGVIVPDPTVIWSTSDSTIVLVSPAGVVRGVAFGSAIVTASVDGVLGNVTVNVTWPAVASVTIDGPPEILAENDAVLLIASPRDAHGNIIPGLGKTWSTSDESIVRVDYVGGVRAMRPGTATIGVRVHGQTAETTITVVADHPYDLVYQSFEEGQAVLRRLDIRDPSGAASLVLPDGVSGANPAISPDGTRIAFVAGGLDGGIWVANVDGTDARELVIGSRFSRVYQPAWSPDGSTIAYTRRPDGNPEQIWVVDVATGITTSITPHDATASYSWPSWSPMPVDGSYRIAFVYAPGWRRWIRTMRADGTDMQVVTSGDTVDDQPSWSPDGQTIAFQRLMVLGHGVIWLANAGGGNERALVGIGMAGTQGAPAWSPDGRFIAFASRHETFGQPGSVNEIYTIRLDTWPSVARRTWGGGEKGMPTWIMR